MAKRGRSMNNPWLVAILVLFLGSAAYQYFKKDGVKDF